MKFAVADLEYLNAIGFNTEHMRKSVDGTKVMAHAEFVLSLASPDKVEVYNAPSDEFKALLSSSEWSSNEYAEADEIFE